MMIVASFKHVEKISNASLNCVLCLCTTLCYEYPEPGVLAHSCNPATWRFRVDQKAAWKVSQASGIHVWRDSIAVLKAGYHFEE